MWPRLLVSAPCSSQVIGPLKDNPQAKSCIADFNRHLQAFQKEGTTAIGTSVLLEREYYQDQATPQLLLNFYQLCKTLITSRSTQSQQDPVKMLN